jgi:hypothetical protein
VQLASSAPFLLYEVSRARCSSPRAIEIRRAAALAARRSRMEGPIIRSVVGLVCLAIVGCSDGVEPSGLARGNAPAPGAPSEAPVLAAPPAEAAPAVACPTGARVADDLRVSSVALVGDVVFYRAESRVLRVGVDGTTRSEIYASTALRGAHADGSGLYTVELGDATTGTATLRRVSASGDVQWTTPQPTWLAVATTLFASDETHLFVKTEKTDGRETLYSVTKATGAATELTPATPQMDELGLSHAQLANKDIWYVRANNRVFRLPAELDPATGERTGFGTPREVFGSEYFACQLGVGARFAACTDGKSLQRRELSGANPKSLIDGAAPGALAVAALDGDTLFMRVDEAAGGAVRAVDLAAAPGAGRSVACAAGQKIAAVAVDASRVVWADERGVHVVAR